MPFALHSDFIHLQVASSCVAFGGTSPFRMQILLLYLHAAYLRLVSFLLPAIHTFCTTYAGLNLISTGEWFNFIQRPQIFRELLILKLPYLGFDLACALVLYRLGNGKKQSLFLFRFWWLNPILIFATYIFGRHETIALFFILLSLYWIQRKQIDRGLFGLGIAIALRYYALFILPFYVFSLGLEWKKRLRWLMIGLAPWLVVNLLTAGMQGTPEIVRLAAYPSEMYVLPLKFSIAAWDNLYLFPLLYSLLLLHRLYNRAVGWQPLVRYSLGALLLLFATAYVGQSPHYWTWFLPLLAVQVIEDRRLLPLHGAQIIFLVVYSFIGQRSTAGYLLAPLAPEFFWSLPAPIEWISQFTAAETVISLAHTAFSAVTLWMAYLVLQRIPPLAPLPDLQEAG